MDGKKLERNADCVDGLKERQNSFVIAYFTLCPQQWGDPAQRSNHTVMYCLWVVECKLRHTSNIHTHSDKHTHLNTQTCYSLSAKGHTGQQLLAGTVRGHKDSQRALEGHILLFVSWVPAFVAVGAVGGWDRVDRGALFAGGMGRMWRVGEAGSRLASVVVKLHQAEYQVWGHQLKRIRWIGYDIPRGESEQMGDQI